MSTKIPWCDETWNPVWGCYSNCPYCYAKKIAKRFGKTEEERMFFPTWKESNFNKKFAKNTKRVFVNSMSDIVYWKREWMYDVLAKIMNYPDIQFIFLTKKRREAYEYLYPHIYPRNVVLGVTFTKIYELFPITEYCTNLGYNWLLNLEPILESFDNKHVKSIVKQFDWIILGAETGNRKGKVIPELSWYRHLLDQHDIPVFLKPSLDKYTPPELIRREFITKGVIK